ncbi:MAG: hypothetical protein ACM3QZ_09965 [Solirubrobacterales bacterium]
MPRRIAVLLTALFLGLAAAALILIFPAGAAVKDVTKAVSLLGRPFTTPPYARNVWDMQLFNGKIYLGHGDSVSNAGPIPVVFYDPESNKFVREFTVDEEQIHRYRIVDGQLVIPGHDARESWDYGNFYRLENKRWKKYRTLPDAVHVFDLTSYNGRLYAAVTSQAPGRSGVVMSSGDKGLTWRPELPANRPFYTMGDTAYGLFACGGKLYGEGLLLNETYYGQLKYNNLLVMTDAGAMTQNVSGRQLFPKSKDYWYLLYQTAEFNNRLVYLGVRGIQNGIQWSPEGLYSAAGLGKQVQAISLGDGGWLPSDLLVRGNRLYVLAYRKDTGGQYTNAVFQSSDSLHYRELFRFTARTFARSFEMLNGDFYFGLGCEARQVDDATGDILKVPGSAYTEPAKTDKQPAPNSKSRV